MDSTMVSTSILGLFFGIKWYKAPIQLQDTTRSLVLDYGQSLFRGKSISTTFQWCKTLSCLLSPLSTLQTLFSMILPSFHLLDPSQKQCFETFLPLVKSLKLIENSLFQAFVLWRLKCSQLLMKSINRRKEGKKGAIKENRNKVLKRIHPRNKSHKLSCLYQLPQQQRNEG